MSSTARLSVPDTVGPALVRERRGRAFPDPKDALPFESVEREFDQRPAKPDPTGYRKRRVYSGQTATLWNYRSPRTVAETLRAVDEVLALRHGQDDVATLSGIAQALALDATFGEDVPDARTEFPDSFTLGQAEVENRRLRATVAALTGDIAKARLALAQRLPDTAATLLLYAETAGGDALGPAGKAA